MPAKAKPNRLIRIWLKSPLQLRAPQLVVLQTILEKSGCTLNEWVDQVIDATIAECKRLEFLADSRFSGGPLIPTPTKSNSKLTHEDVENILALKSDGMKTTMIAERFGTSCMTIRRVLCEHADA